MALAFARVLLLIALIGEIAVLVFVGRRIGILPTIGLVLLTSAAGSILLRLQGLGVLAKIRAEMGARRFPGKDIGHGALVFAGGLLLLAPGFITDMIGLLLFVPPIREWVWKLLAARVTVMAPGFWQAPDQRPGSPGNGKVFDLEAGEFEVRDKPPSPWNRRELD